VVAKHPRKGIIQAHLPPQFFVSSNLYHKNDPSQWALLEDLTLYITKGHHPLSIMANPWLKHLLFVMDMKNHKNKG
jgi:hypothetical protein